LLPSLQYGNVIDSALHDVGFGWSVKGGSAHLIIAGNRIYRTETAGLMLGFDTGGRLLGSHRTMFVCVLECV